MHGKILDLYTQGGGGHLVRVKIESLDSLPSQWGKRVGAWTCPCPVSGVKTVNLDSCPGQWYKRVGASVWHFFALVKAE